MSEFDQNRNSPEIQLIARMKLQRVVFGAFALVLVCLFALGVDQYRNMQHDMQSAQTERDTANQLAGDAAADRAEMQEQLKDTREDLAATRIALGLEKARLAIHEVRVGNLTRARQLAAESRSLGPPPWWPLVDRLTRPHALRFEVGDHGDQPILCGAASGDGSRIGVVRRGEGGTLAIEVFAADSGDLIGNVELSAKVTEGSVNGCHLNLSENGNRFFLRTPKDVLSGSLEDVEAPYSSSDIIGGGVGEVIDVSAEPDLSVIYEAHGLAGVVVRRKADDGSWVAATQLPGNGAVVSAVAPAAQGFVAVRGRAVVRRTDLGVTKTIFEFSFDPDYAALHPGPGVIYAAALTGELLELVSTPLDGGKPIVVQHTAPAEPSAGIRFLGDGGLLWIGQSGLVMQAGFESKQTLRLGDYGVAFVACHDRGLVFGNRKGELSIRARPESEPFGTATATLPPIWTADAEAHGFVLIANRLGKFVKSGNEWRRLPEGVPVALTPMGAAWQNALVHLPDGTTLDDAGSLLGGFSDGTVLLYAGQRKMVRAGGGRFTETILPTELAPSASAIAARGDVAALLVRDSVLVTDFEDEPVVVGGRMKAGPDHIALDAAGRVIAIGYGPTIHVQDWKGGGSHTVRAEAGPSALALLFDGSVLVTLEAGSLVFYEVKSGVELARLGTEVTAMAASSDNGLNVVSSGRMHEVAFGD